MPTRLHAATKPQVLGLILICLAIALSLRSWPVVAFLVPVVLMQLATAPLSAHMVGRQAYRNGTIDETALFVDELAESRRTPPPPAAARIRETAAHRDASTDRVSVPDASREDRGRD